MNKNPSKEQIINQAFKFHLKGNIAEASKYYQIFLDRGFSDARVNNNLGEILRAKGNLKKAELLTRQAIKMVPNFADAHVNLGSIFKEMGKLEEARKELELTLTDVHDAQDLRDFRDTRLEVKKGVDEILSKFNF